MEQHRFNLLRSFSLGSFVAIIIAAILLGWMFRLIAIDELTNQAERNNIILARAMSNAVWPKVKGVLGQVNSANTLSADEKALSIQVLEKSIRKLLENTNVIKIKIFDTAGYAIFSTDHQEIGVLDKSGYFSSETASQGAVHSTLSFKSSIQSTQGVMSDRHILESYLPVNNPASGQIEGFFEIYSDITDSYHYMQQNQIRFMSVLGGILAFMYFVLFFVVRHADKVIKKQAREREGYLHEIENINADLDDHAKELAMARDLALDASKAKSTFLANMSHELRTPLNAIIGYSEMMAEELSSEGRDADARDLNKIKTAGAHLLAVINDILDLSKIEAGRMDLHLEEINVRSAVNDVVETTQPLADKGQNTIKVQVADDIENMFTDLTRIRQVLLNLLSNACKFTRNGVVSLDISRASGDSGMIVFTIKDTGVGMSDSQLENIFEAFKQADLSTTREFGGTGLGLTISKRFCEMLGGEISVRSEPGSGSTFKVTLPERSSRSTGRETVSSQNMVSAENVRMQNTGLSTPERRNRVSKVLVIDDDIAVSDLVMRTLSVDGFDVSVVNDASKGIEAASEWMPDVILLDVMMPEIDGWAILKGIKSHEILKSVPVIMMTVVDNYAMADSLGADGFVVKPINRKKLKKAITLCLRNSQIKNISDNVMANG